MRCNITKELVSNNVIRKYNALEIIQKKVGDRGHEVE